MDDGRRRRPGNHRRESRTVARRARGRGPQRAWTLRSGSCRALGDGVCTCWRPGGFAGALGVGAVAAASPPGFLLLSAVAFVCGHEALVSRLGERLRHRQWVRAPSTAVRVLWFLLLLVTDTPTSSSSDHDEADGNPFLPPRESRVRRLAVGVLAVPALFGATVLLG